MLQASFIRSLFVAVSAVSLLAACTQSKTTTSEDKTRPTVATEDSKPPEGSYRFTCDNATVANDTLTANCANLTGTRSQSSLSNLSNCQTSLGTDGDIGNIDGSLICIPALPLKNGFVFPKSDATINGWVENGDLNSQHAHGWGLWAGLTDFVGVVDGQPVRAFQSWATPENMIYRIQNGQTENLSATDLVSTPSLRLSVPNQFSHAEDESGHVAVTSDTQILVSVAYNPPAAEHAISNSLFLESTLNGYLDAGLTKIPEFPADGITIKPVYKVISASNTVDGIFTMPGWPGTPSPAEPFPENDWDACVYIDISGAATGGNSIDVGCDNRTAANTFSVTDFIHDTLSAEDAGFLNAQFSLSAAAGDTAILVGMHVTTREIERWTWQSFFWAANADAPVLPSSSQIAALRPAGLDSQAAHYAMTQAFQMVAPVQPIRGGQNVGTSVIAYNPHLEAGFSPRTFNPIRPITNGSSSVTNKYGVQTNCMSCHAMATYGKDNQGSLGYVADQYMALDDPLFGQLLQLDFAWSIQGNVVKDVSDPNTSPGQ